jgi:hypothetical protein
VAIPVLWVDTWQTSKTWKASTDPECLSKVRRVLGLYDQRALRWPSDLRGRVRAADLLPRKGKAWRPQFTLPCLIPPKFPVR